MGNLFSYDNPLYQILLRFSEALYLGFLWLVFSIPIVTIGASTTALYYTTNKVLIKRRGKIWQNFWNSFKSNFKQSTLAWLLIFAIYILTFVNFYILRLFTSAEGNQSTDFILLIIMLVIVTAWASYVFPYIARFENSIEIILKNAFIMSFSNLPWSGLLVLLFVLAFIIIFLYPPLLFVILPCYMCCANLILERVFRKYISPEDLALEEERNRIDTY